jgi:hypothetical protein
VRKAALANAAKMVNLPESSWTLQPRSHGHFQSAKQAFLQWLSGWGSLNRLCAQISDPFIRSGEFFSQLEASGIIQGEYGKGSPAGGCQALNVRAPERKVIRPTVSPGMKQNFHLARQRVDSTQVWSFVQIAAMASERQVSGNRP